MATRLPLVLGDDGLPQQLQTGDTIPGTSGPNTGSFVLAEYDTDPSPAVMGVPYIKVTRSGGGLSANNSLSMFFGAGFPINFLSQSGGTPTGFELSVMTSGGIKRTPLV